MSDQNTTPVEMPDGSGTGTATTQPAGRSFTQQELDKFLSEARREERKKIPTDYEDIKKRLEEFERGQLSEVEKIKVDLTGEQSKRVQAETDLKAARQELLRMRVAAQKALPAEWIDRLRGETEEEMAKDADVILASIQKVVVEQQPDKKPRPLNGAGGNGGQPAGPFTDEFMKRAKDKFKR